MASWWLGSSIISTHRPSVCPPPKVPRLPVVGTESFDPSAPDLWSSPLTGQPSPLPLSPGPDISTQRLRAGGPVSLLPSFPPSAAPLCRRGGCRPGTTGRGHVLSSGTLWDSKSRTQRRAWARSDKTDDGIKMSRQRLPLGATPAQPPSVLTPHVCVHRRRHILDRRSCRVPDEPGQ